MSAFWATVSPPLSPYLKQPGICKSITYSPSQNAESISLPSVAPDNPMSVYSPADDRVSPFSGGVAHE